MSVSMKSFPVPKLDENESDAPIQRVVIYRNGAELTRTWEKSVQSGIHHVRFTNFPQKYLTGSLRIQIEGSAAIKEVCETGAVSSDCVPVFGCTPDSEEKRLDHSRKRDELKVQREFIEKRLETWEAYRQVVIGTVTAPPNGMFKEGAFIDLHDFLWKYEGEFIRLKAALQQLNDNIADLDEKFMRKKPVLSSLSDLKIILEVGNSGPITLSITYSVSLVEWKPQYDMRFRQSDNTMKLTFSAWIIQSTGEDWTAAQETHVSSGLLPNFAPNELRNPGFQRRDGIPIGSSDAALLDAEPIIFKIDAPVSFGHERAVRVVTLTYHQFENLDWVYKCHPRQDLSVYLSARFSNQAPWKILPGPASVFCDGHFISNIDLGLISCFEKTEVFLGRQAGVTVKRKPPQRTTKPLTSANGMDEGNIQVEAEYSEELEVRNDRKQPITLVLLDDLPVSNDPRIKVTVVHPKVTKAELESGITNHRIDMGPASSRSVKSIYKLEHPNKLSFSGRVSNLP